MSSKHHTPIDHLMAAHATKSPTPHSRPVESEPFSPKKDTVEIQQVVERTITDRQVKLHVEVRKDVPEIPPDLKKIGITTTASSQFSTHQSLKLPIDKKKLPSALQAPITDSIRWLAEFTKFLIMQSHASIKSAHQNVIEKFIQKINRMTSDDLR